MKDVLAAVSKILFYALALAVLMWTATLTIHLVSLLLPGDNMTPFFALALFDGGALAWALNFLYHAQGIPQRAIAILMMILDLIGVIVMSIAELFLGGQALAAVPAGLGPVVLWAVGIWTALNVIGVYAFHIVDPKQMQEIRVRSLHDRVQSEALTQAEALIRDEAAVLGSQIAGNVRADVLARLGLLNPPSQQQPAAQAVITGTMRDVPVTVEQPAPAAYAAPADVASSASNIAAENPTKASRSAK